MLQHYAKRMVLDANAWGAVAHAGKEYAPPSGKGDVPAVSGDIEEMVAMAKAAMENAGDAVQGQGFQCMHMYVQQELVPVVRFGLAMQKEWKAIHTQIQEMYNIQRDMTHEEAGQEGEAAEEGAKQTKSEIVVRKRCRTSRPAKKLITRSGSR